MCAKVRAMTKNSVIGLWTSHILFWIEERVEETNGLDDPSEIHESFEFFLNEP